MAALKGIPSTWNCAANDNDDPTSFPSQPSIKQSSSTTWARTLRSAASVAQLAQEFLNGTPRRQEQPPQPQQQRLQPQQISEQAVEESEDEADEARRIVDEMDDPVDILFACLQNAKTSQEYREYARQLDILEGNHRWKYDEESDECNMRLIRSRLGKLKEAHRTGDMEEMVRLVRSDLTRDLGGMCNARLYQHTWSGTKTLIEEYTEVVKYTIERIAHYCDLADPLEVEKILVDMKAARQSFGNTGLMLSGGGTLGMCHIGVVKCLLEEDLLPRVVCGSSAGSIVGSVLCTQKADEVGAQLEELCKGDLSVFQGFDEIQGPAGMAFNLARGRCAFNIHNLCRVMKRLLGNVTFREAYNYSGRILNIHVSSRDKFSLPRLLNYQTSPNVVVWTAVASSCALPGVFEPPGLRAKDPETGEITFWGHLDDKWIDGSIEGDLPARTMERLFNVNNFIVSQVNPHVQPFLDGNVDTPLYSVSAQSILQKPIVKKGLRLAQASCIYALDGLMDRGFDFSLVKMGHSVLGQKYHGDITILPDISWVPWLKVLANPELDFMVKAVSSGEKATWPKLDRVRNNVAIELSLNAAIKHIHSARIRPMQRSEPRPRKVLPSARSDYNLTQMWQRPTSSRSMRPVPSRRATHRPTRSWYDPSDVPNFLPVHHTTEHILSSSDEARSELSSPVTSYEDEDFTDVTARNSAEVSRSETPRANVKSVSIKDDAESRRFLSQPPSPTNSFKGSSYFAAEPAAMMTAQPTPHSSHLKRAMTAFSNLQMTSTPMAFQGSLGRKKQRQ